MAAACEALGVPVVSGNVSLFNESGGESIYPTPVVGAVGLLEDASTRLTAGFRETGDTILLLGVPAGDASLAGSEYLAHVHGTVAGQPAIDLDAEAALQSLLVSLAGERLLRSAHDCSDGGLAVTLAESAIIGGQGAVLSAAALQQAGRWDAGLFGEAPSRVVVSCPAEQTTAVVARAREAGVPAVALGTVGGERLVIDGYVDATLAELTDAFEGGLERALGR
jgi:phosphoribosylformylglycinamidine synthase